jgi:hypothetical protein
MVIPTDLDHPDADAVRTVVAAGAGAYSSSTGWCRIPQPLSRTSTGTSSIACSVRLYVAFRR